MNRKRIMVRGKTSNDSIAARETGGDYLCGDRLQSRNVPGGTFGDFCDYRPRYEEAYSIYEKAKKHVKNLKKGVDNDNIL